MSSLFSYTLLLQIWFIYNEISQCFGAAGLADVSFNLGFKVDFASDVANTQTSSFSSGIETNLQAYGGVGIGEVAVAGELAALGTTLFDVPMSIFGAASFDEDLSVVENVVDNVESSADIMFLFGD